MGKVPAYNAESVIISADQQDMIRNRIILLRNVEQNIKKTAIESLVYVMILKRVGSFNERHFLNQ